MADRARAEAQTPRTTLRVRALYHRVAPFYDAFRVAWSRVTRPIECELDRLFRERIGPQARILELAPGTGINVVRLLREAPRFASYLGIDASEDMLERARPRAKDDARIVLRLGDATELRHVDGVFDFIVCTWMLSHLDAPAETARAALAKLAPQGTAVFVFFSRPSFAPLRWLFDALGHVFRYRTLEPALITDLQDPEASSSCAAGMATLAVFRGPSRGEERSSGRA
jgi:demethylmenaquinone methyltransferase / 2-methoxy-6-polyprenyl-1,4-benzoquinol methylase